MNSKRNISIRELLYDNDAIARLEERARTEEDCENVDCVYILHTLRKAWAKVKCKDDLDDFENEIYVVTNQNWYWYRDNKFANCLSYPENALVALIASEAATEHPIEEIEQAIIACDTADFSENPDYDKEATGTAILQIISKFVA